MWLADSYRADSWDSALFKFVSGFILPRSVRQTWSDSVAGRIIFISYKNTLLKTIYLPSQQHRYHNCLNIVLRLLSRGYLPFSSVSGDYHAKWHSIIEWFNVVLFFMKCTDLVQWYARHFRNRWLPSFNSANALYS